MYPTYVYKRGVEKLILQITKYDQMSEIWGGES